MSYTLLEQYGRDIDYYFYNINIGLVHFASAGGRLPSIIEGNDLNNEQLHLSVLDLPSLFEVEINPNLSQILGIEGEQLQTYLVDFVSIAKKGLFSFDKTKISDPEDRTYHVVAWPKSSEQHFLSLFILLNSKISNVILNMSNIPFSQIAKENWSFDLNLE